LSDIIYSSLFTIMVETTQQYSRKYMKKKNTELTLQLVGFILCQAIILLCTSDSICFPVVQSSIVIQIYNRRFSVPRPADQPIASINTSPVGTVRRQANGERYERARRGRAGSLSRVSRFMFLPSSNRRVPNHVGLPTTSRRPVGRDAGCVRACVRPRSSVRERPLGAAACLPVSCHGPHLFPF